MLQSFCTQNLSRIPFYDLISYESQTISLCAFFTHLLTCMRKKPQTLECSGNCSLLELLVFLQLTELISEGDDTLQPVMALCPDILQTKLINNNFFARYYLLAILSGKKEKYEKMNQKHVLHSGFKQSLKAQVLNFPTDDAIK